MENITSEEIVLVEPAPENLTPEEIARCYSACMDSVNLINSGKPNFVSDTDWEADLSRNVEHLQLMLSKDYWSDEDLSPLEAAVA